MRFPTHCAAVLAGLIGVLPPFHAASQVVFSPAQPLDGIAVVVEGDLLNVNGLPVRIYGIDAPEIGQTCRSARGEEFDCGAAARSVLEGLIGTGSVQCEIFSILTNKEQVGTCTSGGRDIGAVMVVTGWAFPQRALSNRYERLEARAQSARAGLWAGRAERPWIWRRRQDTVNSR